MKLLVSAALIAGQLLITAQPVAAAGLERLESSQGRTGTFAGARLQLRLGGAKPAKAQFGLSVAPMLQVQGADGAIRTRFGHGVGFGFADGERVAKLSFGGRPASAFAQREGGVDNKNASGLSTLGTAALVAGGVLAALGLAYVAYAEALDCDEDEECS